MGGDLTVVSPPSEGATFTLRLPRMAGASAARRDQEPDAEA
jgi:signal transduction histidine kinase